MKNQFLKLEDKKIFENPNPNAKIGFILVYPVHFYVYKNIYKHLQNQAEFIVDLGAFFPVEQPDDLIQSIISLLVNHNVYFRILYHDDYHYHSYLDDFFSKYELLVSLWPNGCINLKSNLLRRRVSLMYGAGKNLNTFRHSQRKWDLYLSYGKHDFEILKLYTNAKIVGNPKFDDWFNNEFDTAFLKELQLRLNSSKKTILYLPTHGDLGSIKDLAEPLKKLSPDYNIIVKLHHFNFNDEPELVEKLKHENLILFKDDIDLLPLLKIADVVLSDNSSAIFDAILADKPLVVADFITKEFLDTEHRMIKRYRRALVTRPTTYSDSIEQRIKKEGLVVTIQQPQQLAEGIEHGLKNGPFYKSARKKIREDLFAFNDGKCGQRAADALIDLLNTETLPEKPVLYHVMEAFESETGRRTLSEQKIDVQKITEYENLLYKKIDKVDEQRVIFSVIVIHDPAKIEFLKNEFLKSTLRSLFGQTFPQQNYEIIVTDGLPEREIKEIIKEIPQVNGWVPAMKYVTVSDNSSDLRFIDDAVNQATGEIVCFIESGHTAPADWLLKFYFAYKKHPDVAGIGGYSVKRRGVSNIFDMYYYLELGKKQGVHKEGHHYLDKLYEVKSALFYENPAGTLINMSYKKQILEDLNINYQLIQFIELAEMMIKKKVLQEGNLLCFIPSRVTDLETMTFKRFVQKNFKRGLALYLFCLANPNLKKYYSYNFFSIIKLPILNVFGGYPKARLSLVIFIGTLFRWLGGTYGLFMILKS